MKFWLILGLWFFSVPSLYGQLNYIDNGGKALYWGISLGFNVSNFGLDRKPISAENDTIISLSSQMGPGFDLGIIGNWQFNRFFDLRFIPTMVFQEQILTKKTLDRNVETRINGTYLTFPLHIRYKSLPIGDLRVFLIGGLKYQYNIVSQYRAENDIDFIPLHKHNLGAEFGIGIQYFFPYFIFSPEIKFSHGMFNVLGPNQAPVNESILNGLYNRTLTITINFEG